MCSTDFVLRFQGFQYSSPDSSADCFGGRSARECLYSSPQSHEESDLDLNHSFRLHALIENIVNFISGDVGNAPAFKEPEESVSTSPQAIIIAMEQQQCRAEVCSDSLFVRCLSSLPPTDFVYVVPLWLCFLYLYSCVWRPFTRLWCWFLGWRRKAVRQALEVELDAQASVFTLPLC